MRTDKIMQFNQLKTTYQSIKPSSLWKEETKSMLLGVMEEKFTPAYSSNKEKQVFSFTPVFALAVLLVVAVFSFTFVQAKNTIPGEPLYAVKRFGEKTRFLLTPADKEPVLRAEILAKRVSEAQKIAEKPQSSPSPKSLETLNRDFQKELVALKQDLAQKTEKTKEKEIAQNKSEVEEVVSPIAEEFTLPIKGELLTFYSSPDLIKIIEETKELISANNFEAALEKTKEIENMAKEKENEETEEAETKETVETIEEAPVIEEQEVAPIKKSQVIPANPQIINPVSDDKIILTPELTPKPDSDFQGNMMEGM